MDKKCDIYDGSLRVWNRDNLSLQGTERFWSSLKMPKCGRWNRNGKVTKIFVYFEVLSNPMHARSENMIPLRKK
jgi:hypothetical protein